MTETGKNVVEKLIILVGDNVFGAAPVKEGQFKALDSLALRGQCGFVSTFKDSHDTLSQLIGTHYFTIEKLSKLLGEMKLAVLKDQSTYSGFGEVFSIKEKSLNEIYNQIQNLLKTFCIVVVEMHSLDSINQMTERLFPSIDKENVALIVLCGYGPNAKIPIFKTFPVVDPSWKVIGPDVVESLSVEHPMLFVSASKQLTRIDNVKFFSEKEIEDHCGMGILPICQLFRECSYYTGSTWKYGA
ncbi:hypothetical protein M9Y10_002143 [Tritrichomonas musculus]|uniref:Uncharacterized protein n=1 Tax=Tritrichomonas musculus TaxID=1915356 RepID=A0ABR2L9X6_9EUKA